MPIYDYECHTCGPFDAMRPMAQFRDPCACPACGIGAPRKLLSAPAIADTDQTRRNTLALDFRNASSQRLTKAAHPAACGCCVRRWPIPSGMFSSGARVFSSSGPLRRSGR
jgi:putative FmdB family regulatory protein